MIFGLQEVENDAGAVHISFIVDKFEGGRVDGFAMRSGIHHF